LRRAENGSDAGFYWEKTTSVHLNAEESFRYVERSFSGVSGGGLSDVVAWWHTRDGGNGVQYMDGVPWERYLIDG